MNKHYHIEQILHIGKNTTIARALCLHDNHTVILKQLHIDYPDTSLIHYIQREYEITHALKNVQGVIQAIQLLELENKLTIILEDTHSITLGEYINNIDIDIKTAILWLQSLADILDTIHQHKIIHKDINPSNIIIQPQQKTLQFIDFGIATYLKRSQQESHLINQLERVGTLNYIPPEQTGRINLSLDYRADYYSLGVTFYQILTGHLPFEHNDDLAIIHAHIAQTPITPEKINPNIPTALSAIILKLMAKSPDARYQSIYGLQQDLLYCLAQIENQTTPVETFIPGQHDHNAILMLPQKLYGRESAIQTAQQAIKQIQTSKALLWIKGVSGMGKTTLINEIIPFIEPKARFIKSKIEQIQYNTPYHTISIALQHLYRSISSESPQSVKKHQQALSQLLHPNIALMIEFIPELKQLLGNPPVVQDTINASEREHRFQLTVSQFLQYFTTATHPLVMFLDDLQWIDDASLHLLDTLLRDKQLQHFLLIGAWRENEVSAEHPLLSTIKQLNQYATTFSISLTPIDIPAISQLLKETLTLTNTSAIDEDAINTFSQLIYHRTAGNPFFIHQFLHYLADQELLTYQQGQWHWDIDHIRQQNFTHNVIDLMMEKIHKLPAKTQSLLHQAACLGHCFTLSDITALSQQTSTDTANILWPAIEAELLTTTHPLSGKAYQHYQFIHDKIQQSALEWKKEADRKPIYLAIARQRFTQHNTKDESTISLFDIVTPWNLAQDIVSDAKENYQLANLNLKAGLQAKKSGALLSAAYYFSSGLNAWSKIPSDSSSDEYHQNLLFELTLNHAECLFLTNQKEQALILLQQLQSTASNAQKVQIFILQSQLLTTVLCLDEALESGLAALSMYHINIEKSEDKCAIQLETILQKIEQMLQQQSIEQWLQIKTIEDKNTLSQLHICIHLIPIAYLTKNYYLYFFMLAYPLYLSLMQGYSRFAGTACMYYALLCVIKDKHYQRAYKIGLLGLELEKKELNNTLKATIYFHWVNWILPWKEPLKKNIYHYLDLVYTEALHAGDLHIYTTYSQLAKLMIYLTFGEPLAKLATNVQHCLEKNHAMGITQDHPLFSFFTQFVTYLKEELPHSYNYCSNYIHDRQKTLYTASQHISHVEKIYLLVGQIIFTFIFNEPALLEDKLNQLLHIIHTNPESEFFFITYITKGLLGLVLSDKMLTLKQPQHPQYRPHFNKAYQQLKTLTPLNPTLLNPLFFYTQAEKNWLDNAFYPAQIYYQKAINAAAQIKNLWLQAKVNERMAQFYLSQELNTPAKGHLFEAYYLFQQWGASAKCQQMLAIYPLLLPAINTIQTRYSLNSTQHSSSTTLFKDNLDLNTIIKATLTLSKELSMAELIRNILTIALENAGAQRCILLLNDTHDNYFIEGEIYVKENMLIAQHIQAHFLLSKMDNIPMSVIQSVINQQQEQLINPNNTSSLLCLPILLQQRLVGILYFEHNDSAGVFHQQRQELLKLLASQAAISIENARLYENMEEKIKERTDKLEKAQAKLLLRSRQAGMAEIAQEVMHNIGNALTPLKVSTQISLSTIKDNTLRANISRAFTPIIEALEQSHLPDKTRFIKILDIIPQNLNEEHQQLENHLIQINERVEHIEKIIHLQSQYTDIENMTENLDINQVLLDSINMLGDILHTDSIEISTQFATLPPYQGEKHQLLQVFVNLIKNAHEAIIEQMPAQGILTITTEYIQQTTTPTIKITFKDNGCGFTNELKSLLFNYAYTTKKTGTGVGLHVSGNYINKIHGQLTANSEGKGKGAVFTVLLPLKK